MNTLTIDVARERMRDKEQRICRPDAATRVRALRRARRDAEARALRLRRLLSTV